MDEEQQPQTMVAAGSKVATTFIDGMKAQPLVLAMLVSNLMILAFLFYALTDLSTRRDKQMSDVIERCLPELQRGGPH